MKMSSLPSQSILLYIWGFIWLLSNLINIVSDFPDWILNLFLLVGVILTILIIRNKIGYLPAETKTNFYRRVFISALVSECVLILSLLVILYQTPHLISVAVALVVGVHFIPFGFFFYREYFFTSFWIVTTVLVTDIWFPNQIALSLGPILGFGLILTGFLIQMKKQK